jgi:hypothetical protein
MMVIIAQTKYIVITVGVLTKHILLNISQTRGVVSLVSLFFRGPKRGKRAIEGTKCCKRDRGQ